MSQFLSPLFLRSYSVTELNTLGSKAQLYDVWQDFSYQSDKLGVTITVVAPYRTDFASIPRAAWSLLDPEDPVIAWPSVIHDYLYSQKGTLPDGTKYERGDADAVLREAMELSGASAFIRESVYLMVHQFGGSHWNK